MSFDTIQGLGRSLREGRTTARKIAQDAIAAYTARIASLVQLLSHLADASLLPGVPSVLRPLVALLHLVQAKEAAGQERAAGAHLFASGGCGAQQQEHLAHLIDAQERGLRVFADFAAVHCTELAQMTSAKGEASVDGRPAWHQGNSRRASSWLSHR